MLEHIATFTPADGGPSRTITLRIHGVAREGDEWVAQVEVLGFPTDEHARIRQVDWPSVVEDAARFIAKVVTWKMEHAGGGSMEPPLEPRT